MEGALPLFIDDYIITVIIYLLFVFFWRGGGGGGGRGAGGWAGCFERIRHSRHFESNPQPKHLNSTP